MYMYIYTFALQASPPPLTGTLGPTAPANKNIMADELQAGIIAADIVDGEETMADKAAFLADMATSRAAPPPGPDAEAPKMVPVPDVQDVLRSSFDQFHPADSQEGLAAAPMTSLQLYGAQAAAVLCLVGGTAMIVLGASLEGGQTVAQTAAMPLTVAAVLYTAAVVQNYRHGAEQQRQWSYYHSQMLAAGYTVATTVMVSLGIADGNGALIGAAAGPMLVAVVCWWQAVRKKRTAMTFAVPPPGEVTEVDAAGGGAGTKA
eukprot:SAG22_NODE_3308_length_1789_cov_1.218343_2_plen_260_part_01